MAFFQSKLDFENDAFLNQLAKTNHLVANIYYFKRYYCCFCFQVVKPNTSWIWTRKGHNFIFNNKDVLNKTFEDIYKSTLICLFCIKKIKSTSHMVKINESKTMVPSFYEILQLKKWPFCFNCKEKKMPSSLALVYFEQPKERSKTKKTYISKKNYTTVKIKDLFLSKLLCLSCLSK